MSNKEKMSVILLWWRQQYPCLCTRCVNDMIHASTCSWMGELQGTSPPLPKTLGQIHETLRLLTSTKIGEEFLLVNNAVSHILMFLTQSNLNFLVKCDAVLIDRTFYACLTLFSQIFIVSGRRKHTYAHPIPLPMHTSFLIRKRRIAMREALKKLKPFLSSTFMPRRELSSLILNSPST